MYVIISSEWNVLWLPEEGGCYRIECVVVA
jgi:hypothetical protein